ncbi:MAG: hypothetical protein HGA36_02535 [Candidatus Moranbacteria bacterium]|nr:hypothetical protein [Candidatus Moranbacteria bacterium]
MTEEIKKKKPKRKLTRKQAIKKGNKEFKNFTRELAKSMNLAESGKLKK